MVKNTSYNQFNNIKSRLDLSNYVFFDDHELVGESLKIIKKFQEKNKKILELEKKAFYDNLTGLLNRHGLKEVIKKKFKNREKVSVISIDIKDLREINNNYGTISGDEAIKFVADILKNIFRFNKNIREDDIICRYGGDEFMIILPIIKEDIIKAKIDRIFKKTYEISEEIKKREENNYHLGIHIAHNREHTIDNYKIANNKNNLSLKKDK